MSYASLPIPNVRGSVQRNAPLAPFTWFRVGGPADLLFLPEDEADLASFLAALPSDVPVTVLGVGSNTIVRDGGVAGVVIRLVGKNWGTLSHLEGTDIEVGAGALDISVARFAARNGISGLSFLSGIPGTLGGAIRTNAGCYGGELKDVAVRIEGLNRKGERLVFQGHVEDLGLPAIQFDYRHTDFPTDAIVTRLTLRGSGINQADELSHEIETLQARRSEAQPIREKTGGSTFANPDPPGTPDARSSWKLIDAAGCRGLRVGGAMVSEKHCNFLINAAGATAADLEALGELVRARVMDVTGVSLRWEIRRIGRIQVSN
ncbi:MAG: UDP-N-acetylmuramate dehydrogenase [Pseudomonadota bacterium]